MKTERLGIVMNGVTGRMGTNQHLVRSILAIRAQGGVALSDGRRVIPDPMLVGRNADKLEALAKANGVARWTTDLDAALADPGDAVYFDSASTGLRPGLIRRAIAAGKHIYTEKPVAPTLAEAVGLHRAAQAAGVKHGVVQDKLWLPGLLKLRATGSRRSGRRGTTARRTTAGSSSTCCATGATCSTTSSAR
ncbi:MAG: oxidoreductase [Acidobacteria bacterium]|nr:oxidoreductase [Acidobacteriota bacterium]